MECEISQPLLRRASTPEDISVVAERAVALAGDLCLDGMADISFPLLEVLSGRLYARKARNLKFPRLRAAAGVFINEADGISLPRLDPDTPLRTSFATGVHAPHHGYFAEAEAVSP